MLTLNVPSVCSSRLGSRVVLTKDMDGMLVAVSEVGPWRTL